MAHTVEEEPRQVRVAIVDDTADVRMLLRMAFGLDPRFSVVGEGSNGQEAVSLAAAEQPDLMILDRQMPVMDGVEAIPEIRTTSPRTAIVLYTAGADATTYEAAISAGALDVLDKAAVDGSVTDTIAGVLMDHWAQADATVEVRVGPVASAAARAWVHNTSCILAALRRHPEVLPEGVTAEVLDRFGRFLETWGQIAQEQSEFSWVARTTPAEINRLVEAWAALDRLTDDDLEILSCSWSPPEARPFFTALTGAVLEALEAHAESRVLARTLAAQWPDRPPRSAS